MSDIWKALENNYKNFGNPSEFQKLQKRFRDLALSNYGYLTDLYARGKKSFDFAQEIVIERNKNLIRLNKLAQKDNKKRKNKVHYHTLVGAAHVMWSAPNNTVDKTKFGFLGSLRYDDECFEFR